MFLPRLILSCIILKCLIITVTLDTQEDSTADKPDSSDDKDSKDSAPQGTGTPPINAKGIPSSQYRVICNIKKQRPGLEEAPPQCTAIASSNSSEAGVQDIAKYRGSLPFMRIYEDVLYDQWNDVFNCVGDITVQTITDSIKSDCVCMVAFDYMYKGIAQNVTDCNRTQQIIGFLSQLKKLNPGTFFGIVLSSKRNKIINAFDVESLNQHVDFYIAKAYHYRVCALYPEPTPDLRRATEADMEFTICTLKEQNYPLCKVVLMIDIIAYSYKTEPDTGTHHSGNVTYTKICSKKPSADRVFCLDTLEQFFQKAKLANTYQMMGIYVLYADFDDYCGVCGCQDEAQQTAFPILKELVRGLDGEESSGCLGSCGTWAQYNDVNGTGP